MHSSLSSQPGFCDECLNSYSDVISSVYLVRHRIFNHSFEALLPSALWVLWQRTRPCLEKYNSSIPRSLAKRCCQQRTAPLSPGNIQYLASNIWHTHRPARSWLVRCTCPGYSTLCSWPAKAPHSSYIASNTQGNCCISAGQPRDTLVPSKL